MSKPTFVFYAPTAFILDGEEYDVGTYYTQDSDVMQQVRAFAEIRHVFKRGQEVFLDIDWVHIGEELEFTVPEDVDLEEIDDEEVGEVDEIEEDLIDFEDDDDVDEEELGEFEASELEMLEEDDIEELGEIADEEDIDDELIDEFVENVSVDEESEEIKNQEVN